MTEKNFVYCKFIISAADPGFPKLKIIIIMKFRIFSVTVPQRPAEDRLSIPLNKQESGMINIKEYVKNELKAYDGKYLPVRAGLLEQIFVRSLPPSKLHPNPEDVFCDEKIGPNDGIIEKYTKKIRFNQQHSLPVFDEPVIVEKMKPDGYLLINGHHRWAAALMLDLKKIPVKVVNMTHVRDILEMLEESDRVKRASIDLDDVIFCRKGTEEQEKPLPFPFNLIYPEPVRKGIPALLYTLQNEGYDIWVYSSGYTSTDHISGLFRHHQIYANGIINGADHKKAWNNNNAAEVRALMEKKYRVTLNINTDCISWIRSDTKEFDQIDIRSKGDEWSEEVISVIRSLGDL